MTISSLARGALPRGRASLAGHQGSASIASLCQQRFSRPAVVILSTPSHRKGHRHFSSSHRAALRTSLPTYGLFGGWGRSSQPQPTAKEALDWAAERPTESQSGAFGPETVGTQNPSSSPSVEQATSQGSSLASFETDSNLSSSVTDAAVANLDASSSAATIVGKTFDQLELSSWPNVHFMEWALNSVHELTGLPWWAVMVAVTLSARVALVPLAISSTALGIRAHNVKPETEEAGAAIKAATASNDPVARQAGLDRLQKIWGKHGTNPGKMFRLPLIQSTFFMTTFFAVRRLAEDGLVGLQDGVLWLPSLCTPDATYILPVVSAVSSLIVFETGAELGAAAGQAMNPNIKWALRIAVPIGVWFTAYFPAAIFFFWIPNNIWSLGQVLFLQNPKIQKALGMPERIKHETPPPPTTPSGGLLGFLENVKSGYDAERHNQKLHNERSQAYQKWLKPSDSHTLSQPAAPPAALKRSTPAAPGPRSDLFEAAAEQAPETTQSTAPRTPAAKKPRESAAERERKAKLRALMEKKANKQQRV